MKNFIIFIRKHKLIALGILINFSFFISAFWTKWYDFFFFGTSLHLTCRGIDFFQVPKGAYAFFHGGLLNGNLPTNQMSYAKDFLVNNNVYHPFFTILVGGFLMLFTPNFSFYFFMFLKFIITMLLVIFIYKKFKDNKYLDYALFIMLINIYQYNDIRISQYQFLLNVFLLLLLISFTLNKDNLKTGYYYLITLLVKPIGLLWAPILLIKKKYKTLIFGLVLFLILTFIFKFRGLGNYYIDNLIYHIKTPVQTRAIDFMSLETLLRYSFALNQSVIIFLKAIFLLLIIFLSFAKKTNIIKIFYLLILYFLFFYDLIFEYHYSALIPIFTVGLLALPEFQTKASRFLILIISLPGPFFVLRLIKNGFIDFSDQDINPTFLGWQIVLSWQVSLLILFGCIIFIPEIKQVYCFLKIKFLK